MSLVQIVLLSLWTCWSYVCLYEEGTVCVNTSVCKHMYFIMNLYEVYVHIGGKHTM